MMEIIQTEVKKLAKIKTAWIQLHSEHGPLLSEMRWFIRLFQTYEDDTDDKVTALKQVEKSMKALRSGLDDLRTLKVILKVAELKKMAQDYRNDIENKESIVNSIDYNRDLWRGSLS